VAVITWTHSAGGQWRKGKYTPSPKVLFHMLYRVYPWGLLKMAGLRGRPHSQLDAIEDLPLEGQRNGRPNGKIRIAVGRTACTYATT